MAVCAYHYSATGPTFRGTSPAPDACPEAYIVITTPEWTEYQQLKAGALGDNPWNLTVEQGAQIGGAMLAVWALAFVIRLLRRVLSTEERSTEV